TGAFVVFRAKAVVLATGGVGKIYQITSNSWEYTGDGHSMALWAGADLIDMEFIQLHPTGMVWPPSVRGILVTEGVRGDGGVLRNGEGRRFMFDYVPEMFRAETAETEEEADNWYTGDRTKNRRPPDLLPRDEVARAINNEVKEGRGSLHGGVFLDIASRLPADVIKKRLPSMYHQFKELAGVDITKEPMEIGPTAHYVMGGVRVDAETQGSTVPGLYAAGEVAGGMHGANRLGGNSLSDLLVFGRRAGEAAAAFQRDTSLGTIDERQVNDEQQLLLLPLVGEGRENPYLLQQELQEAMQDGAGLAREEKSLRACLDEVLELRQRSARIHVPGSRRYNPGWHTARDLRFMLTIAEAIVRAALERRESRGAHWRLDYLEKDPALGRVNFIAYSDGGRVKLKTRPVPEMPSELTKLFADTASPPPASQPPAST